LNRTVNLEPNLEPMNPMNLEPVLPVLFDHGLQPFG